MDLTGIGLVFNMGSKIIDKFWPDKAEAASREKVHHRPGEKAEALAVVPSRRGGPGQK